MLIQEFTHGGSQNNLCVKRLWFIIVEISAKTSSVEKVLQSLNQQATVRLSQGRQLQWKKCSGAVHWAR